MQDPLQQLRDLHLPAEPAWFPPAPGWWLLVVIALALALALALRALRRRRRRLPFRHARDELDALRAALEQGHLPKARYADDINALLKRVAIHGLRRPEAAPLSGRAWLAFLDSLSGSQAFTRGAGSALGDARFAPAPEVDPSGLYELVRRLVERLERAA